MMLDLSSLKLPWGERSLQVSYIALENGSFVGDLPIQIVIFHSYVKLPEGKTWGEIDKVLDEADVRLKRKALRCLSRPNYGMKNISGESLAMESHYPI